MKIIFKSILTLTILFFGLTSNVAQIAVQVNADELKSEGKSCDPTNCDPERCEILLKEGLCTKEEVAKCKAKLKSTKVASMVIEREAAEKKELALNISEHADRPDCSKKCIGMNSPSSSKIKKK